MPRKEEKKDSEFAMGAASLADIRQKKRMEKLEKADQRHRENPRLTETVIPNIQKEPDGNSDNATGTKQPIIDSPAPVTVDGKDVSSGESVTSSKKYAIFITKKTHKELAKLKFTTGSSIKKIIEQIVSSVEVTPEFIDSIHSYPRSRVTKQETTSVGATKSTRDRLLRVQYDLDMPIHVIMSYLVHEEFVKLCSN